MLEFVGWGSGKHGALPGSGTYNGAAATFTGTAGNAFGASTISLSAGDIVVINQVYGTGSGNIEFNQVVNTTGSQVNLVRKLGNTFVTGATITHAKEYTPAPVTGTLTVNDWDSSKCGTIPLFINGRLTFSGGNITVSGKGLKGGVSATTNQGKQGEGSAGTGSNAQGANGSGAGGGKYTVPGGGINTGGGGGGGHASAGGNGINQNHGDPNGGTGGSAVGSSDMTSIFMGGGGGEGGDQGVNPTNGGGDGAGIMIICAPEIDLTNGFLYANGNTEQPTGNSNQDGNGGGGAGGSIYVITQRIILGTDRIQLFGGALSSTTIGPSGAGSKGRLKILCCSSSGSLTSANYGSFSLVEGGNSFCGGVVSIF